MKALTVQQPWAWAIMHGGKDVENRTQAWGYRGLLAIHAGARISQRGVESPLVDAAFRRRPREVALPDIRGCEASKAIIGVVDLIEVHVAADGCCDSPWGEREYGDGRPGFERVRRRDIVHLVLERPRPLDVPVPCRGALGLWTVPSGVDDQVLAGLELATREAM